MKVRCNGWVHRLHDDLSAKVSLRYKQLAHSCWLRRLALAPDAGAVKCLCPCCVLLCLVQTAWQRMQAEACQHTPLRTSDDCLKQVFEGHNPDFGRSSAP